MASGNNQELIALLNRVLEALNSPLTDEEKKQGWREESKNNWYISLQDEFLKKLEKGEFREDREPEKNLTRDLGWGGTDQGPLAEMIRRFETQWNNKYAEKPDWWNTNPKRRRDWPWS
jgi:hypothetical protein